MKHHLIQVSAYYPPHLGGQEYAVQDLARQLAANGHTVSVLTSGLGGQQRGASNDSGVAVRRMWAVEFGHAAIMPRFPWELFRASGKRTLVHVHIGQAFTPEIVWLLSRLKGFHYIAELHIDFEPSGPAGILLPLYKYAVLGPVLRHAAVVIVLNERTKRIVSERYGRQGRTLVLGNGISEDYFNLTQPVRSEPPSTLRLLFVGRLTKQKNLPVLLEAVARSPQRIHLDIIGDGEELASLRATIKRNGLTGITLHGRLDRSKVLDFYGTCDALVLPSLYEAQPLVLLEAMAARLPIIGTNVIGIADHLHDCGLLAEPTAAGLVQAFNRFYNEYYRLPQLVACGFAKASKLRWRNLLKDYEALYDEVSV